MTILQVNNNPVSAKPLKTLICSILTFGLMLGACTEKSEKAEVNAEIAKIEEALAEFDRNHADIIRIEDINSVEQIDNTAETFGSDFSSEQLDMPNGSDITSVNAQHETLNKVE